MMIPKSIAPIESRLADIPINRRQMKANNSASGMMIETISVVRQSAMNSNTIQVTKKIPSSKLRVTVCTARSTRSSRS